MGTYLVIALIIVCVIASAFFSSSEMAYSSCNPLRLEKAVEEKKRGAKIALWLAEHFDDTLGVILIGNNLVNIAASSLGVILLRQLTGTDKRAWISTLILTIVIIIFGETMPKIIAKKCANSMAVRHAGPLRVLRWIFLPLVRFCVWLVGLITRPLKGDEQQDKDSEAVEELQAIIETAQDEEVLDEERSELVRSAIDFSEISASEVMTARVDVLGINIEDDWEKIREVVEQSPHSRLPVYEGSIDHVIGVLYMNHLLKAMAAGEKPDIRSLMMPPCYVYKTMKLPAVLNALRHARQHLAIVSDEYGGMLGVVSMEDVMEQIVGEIWDETDTVEPEVVRLENGACEVDGDMPLSDFAQLLGLDEEKMEAESETAGGWIVELMDRFPSPGDKVEYQDLTLTVMAMDGRRVERILAERKKT